MIEKSNKEILHAKREIEGHEVFHAVHVAFEIAKLHPDEPVRKTVPYVLMEVLFNPDYIEKNKKTSLKRLKNAEDFAEVLGI